MVEQCQAGRNFGSVGYDTPRNNAYVETDGTFSSALPCAIQNEGP